MSITIKQRMEAAERLAKSIDVKARILSQYGDRSVAAFDETMVSAAIAHCFATWWEHMTDEQVNARLLNLINSTKASRANRAAEQGAILRTVN